MPLPIIIPIAAAAAAGTVGFLIGREMASTSDDDYEEVLTAIPDSESGNGQAGRSEEEDVGPFSMTEAKALEVLQLTAGAAPDAIEEAHRRLMQRLDPEQGGSSYLVELVNRAKAVLLG